MKTYIVSSLILVLASAIPTNVVDQPIVIRGGGRREWENQELALPARIQSLLVARTDYVFSGRRGRDFAKWYSPDVDSLVVSAIGRKEEDQKDQSITKIKESSLAFKNGIFPDDMADLDLTNVAGIPQTAIPTNDHILFTDLFFRAIRLGFNFVPVISTTWLAYFSSSFRNNYWFPWITNCLARSGPAFVKWGQWASTRADMFPEALCNSLAELQSRAPAHHWGFTQSSVERSLKLPKGTIMEVFSKFDSKPVASGSIAQIHRAILRDTKGNDVSLAVKVRHPNVAKLISMDFRLMTLAADVIDKIPTLGWLNVRASVDQFSDTLASQTALNTEAFHLELMNHNFRSWPNVNFPKPIYASEAVIIETFEQGVLSTEIMDAYEDRAKRVYLVDHPDGKRELDGARLHRGKQNVPVYLSNYIVTSGVAVYLKMLIEDGLMHADLHPGNIMIDLGRAIQRTEKQLLNSPPASARDEAMVATHPHRQDLILPFDIVDGEAKINIVDAGMVARLTPDESMNFIGLITSLGEGDAYTAANCVLRFSAYNEEHMSEHRRDAFRTDMKVLFDEKCRGYGTNTDVGEVLRGVLTLIRIHRVRIDANYATLVVNCLCVEGLARRMFPGYNVLEGARPLLHGYYVLCHNAGSDELCRDNKGRQKLMKLLMPMLFYRKNAKDAAFLRKYISDFSDEQGILRPKQQPIAWGSVLTAAAGVGTATYMTLESQHQLGDDELGDSTLLSTHR